jgi:hypothetical protein
MDDNQLPSVTLRQAAYICATACWESNWTLKPVKEIGGEKQKYSPYYGRGLCQLTHLANYAKFEKLLGIPLVDNPDLALDEDVSYKILITGMLKGLFTHVRLTPERALNYVNCRKVVNGTDKAELIASIAEEIERRLVDEPS